MQLNLIGRRASLPVRKVKHSYSGDLHRNVGRLEAGGGRKHGVEFVPCVGDAIQKWTAGTDARRRGNLGDHRVARCVLNHQMIVRIALQLEKRESRIDDPQRSLCRRYAVIGRNGIRRGEGPHIGNRGIGGRVEVDQTRIGVGPGFNGLALNTALGREA